MISNPLKIVLIVLGWVSLALGVMGIFLPLLPTTPFVLLSAYCFSKGSERLHQWLLKQPHLGKVIEDWERDGAIGRNAKILASVMIIALFSTTLFFMQIPPLLKWGIGAVGVGVLVFILTRPTGRRK